MKKYLRRILTLLIISIILVPLSASAGNNIKLWIKGNFINSDVSPIISNNRTLVPIRVVTENLGYSVIWHPEDKSIDIYKVKDDLGNLETGLKLQVENDEIIIYDADTVNQSILKMDNKEMTSKEIDKFINDNSKLKKTDVAPKIINNRTYVPIRAIAELFGEKVTWDSENRVAAIGNNYVPSETSINTAIILMILNLIHLYQMKII